MTMKIRFWGVRGSIPSPGQKTVRYGGNTTCIEVRGPAGELAILDAGTGIFPLAQRLLPEMPLTAHVFITHTHWDHIQGLPFFVPLYVPGNKVRIHGPYDIVNARGIEQVMEVQLQYSFFPIREAELKAGLEYRTLAVGEKIVVGGLTVVPVLMNHPVTNFGYRLEAEGKRVFFTGDHEPWRNIYAPEEAAYAEFQVHIDACVRAFEDAIRDVDLLICDAAYTREEYARRIGWGHGTFDGAFELAHRVGARRLVLTHHEPTRSDDELERVFAEAKARHPHVSIEASLAWEGLEIVL
ncbi:MAG: MBL fold metallo-hydrolase [Rhodocyclaceae bacterium]|nr:MBL fold metallo-hydrolase [Rhodocyclaceae bacterium]